MSKRILIPLLLIALGCSRNGHGAKDAKDPAVVVAPPTSNDVPPAGPGVVFPARDLAKIFDAGRLSEVVGTKTIVLSPSYLEAAVPGTLADVAAVYLEELSNLGWSKIESATPSDDHGAFHFGKDGHLIHLTVSKETTKSSPRTHVIVQFFGNLDSRTLPKPNGTPHATASQPLSSYFTETSPKDEAAAIALALKSDGWQEYASFQTAHIASNDSLTLTFRKQGYLLDAYINALPNNGKTNVTYSIRVLTHELPAPPDAVKVEFDDLAWKMRCEIPGDLKTARDFYRTAMPAAGYTPLGSDESQPTSWNMRFGTFGGDVINVHATSFGKATKINVHGVPASVEIAMQKLDTAKKKAAEKKIAAVPPPPVSLTPEKELFAAKLPLPKDAKEIAYDVNREEITFRSSSKIEALAIQLRDKLSAAGWQEDKSLASVDKNAGFLNFRQAQASLRVILVSTGFGGGTQATISAKGLTWAKAGPVGQTADPP